MAYLDFNQEKTEINPLLVLLFTVALQPLQYEKLFEWIFFIISNICPRKIKSIIVGNSFKKLMFHRSLEKIKEWESLLNLFGGWGEKVVEEIKPRRKETAKVKSFQKEAQEEV